MTVAYNPSCVTNGLVLYLDAGNIKSYPGSGTTWTDLSGNGNTGTLVNGPTYDSANGGSLVFDGSNNYVSTSNIANNLSAFTVSCVFKTNYSGIQFLVAKLVNYSSGAGWGLFLNSGSIRFILQENGSNWGVYYTATGYANNLWHHATAVITGGLLSAMYVDGVAIGTTLVTGTAWTSYSNTVQVRVGTDAAPEFFFKGNISLPQVFTRALSATEILQNFSALRGRFGL